MTSYIIFQGVYCTRMYVWKIARLTEFYVKSLVLIIFQFPFFYDNNTEEEITHSSL